MSNLAARLLTAAGIIPILIAAILWRNPLGVWVVVYAATGLGLREFFNMTLPAQPAVERGFAVAVGMAFAAVAYWFEADGDVLLAALGGVILGGFLFYLFRFGAVETVAARLSALVAGVLYVGLLLTFVALLKKRPDGAGWIFITLTCTWFSDTGAYFAGRFLGPTWPQKLYPAVSPKKTWVGALGGLGGSFLALTVAKLWYLPSLSWVDCALVAAPANALGQLGDLCESLLKRSVGVKDSGNLLPGHGGMLDRIDALLFTAPYVFLYTRFLFGRL